MNYSRYNSGLLFIPDVLFQCPQIISLNLEENYISEISDEIGLLTRLEELIIYDNLISDIPDTICATKLKYLDISNNVFRELRPSLFNVYTLIYIDVSYNDLTEIPDVISNLLNLKKLDISNNNISGIPDNITNLPCLEFLDLSNNKLVALPDGIITKLTNLKEIYLLSNNFGELPIEFITNKNIVLIGLDFSSYSIINNYYYGKHFAIFEDGVFDDIIYCPNLIQALLPTPHKKNIKTWYSCSVLYLNQT